MLLIYERKRNIGVLENASADALVYVAESADVKRHDDSQDVVCLWCHGVV
jgi:hypothetical protein